MDDTSITLLRSDGKLFAIPLTRLSKQDQTYAKSQRKVSEKEKVGPAGDSSPTPKLKAMTAERYEQMMREIADPEMVGLNLVNDNVIDLSPFLRLDMADESQNFVWRTASKMPPIFIAEGQGEHQGEALVFKVLPTLATETHNKAEFDGLVQTLKGAEFEDLKATPVEALNEEKTQFQFYLSATSKSGETRHFYTYLIYYSDRVFSFQANAGSDERASKIIQLAPTAQLLIQPEGNLSEEMEGELKVVIKKLAKLVDEGTAEEVLAELMPKDEFESVKSNPDDWKRIMENFDRRNRPKLKRALADLKFEEAVFDNKTKTVTFAMRPPLRFRMTDGRWVILN